MAVRGKTRFTRGFATAVTAHARTEAQLAALIGAPEWFSVEELAFSGPQVHTEVCAAIACHPVMRSLRVVTGLGGRSAARIATASPPLEVVELGIADGGPDEALDDCPGLPKLARVGFTQGAWMRGVGELVELRSQPVARRLDTITLATGETILELYGDRPGALNRLRVALRDRRTLDEDARDVGEIVRDIAIATIEIVAPSGSAFRSDAELVRAFGCGRPTTISRR